MIYPLYFAAVMTLWPIIAFAGGQGFSSMLALAAIPAIAFIRPGGPRMLALGALALLIAWICASAFWSPTADNLASGSLSESTFSINAASLRIALTGLAAALVLGALLKWPGRPVPETRAWLLGAFAVQGVTLLAMALFTEQSLALFHPLSDKDTEAMQNIVRNANAFALALPILAAALACARAPLAVKVILLAALAGGSLWMFADLGAQTALVAPAFSLVAAGIVWIFKTNGFRILFGALGAYVLASPLIFHVIVRAQTANALPLPDSFRSRVWSWEAVLQKISAAPLFGHGLEASDTWTETYADHPDKLAQVEPFWSTFRIIPGHPHAMPLEMWSETGFIGAALAAFALWTLGVALPRPAALPPRARYAAAGLIGAAAVACSVSYSVWNEAYWASIALVAAAVVLFCRPEAPGER